MPIFTSFVSGSGKHRPSGVHMGVDTIGASITGSLHVKEPAGSLGRASLVVTGTINSSGGILIDSQGLQVTAGGFNVTGNSDHVGNLSFAAGNSLSVDTISEVTTDNGVTIDGTNLKDGRITGVIGNADNYIDFVAGNDIIDVVVGNQRQIRFKEGSRDEVIVGNGAEIDLRVETNSSSGGASPNTTLMISGSTGKVGIHVADPESWLDIAATDDDLMTVTSYNNNPNITPNIDIRKSRGTPSSRTSVSSGDALGRLVFEGYQNNSFRSSVEISATTDDAPSGNYVPGRLEIKTADNNNTPMERVRIDQHGNVGIGTFSTPRAQLETRRTYALYGNLDPQFSVAYSNSKYADFTANSIGDLHIFPQGSNIIVSGNMELGAASGGGGNGSLLLNGAGSIEDDTSNSRIYWASNASTTVLRGPGAATCMALGSGITTFYDYLQHNSATGFVRVKGLASTAGEDAIIMDASLQGMSLNLGTGHIALQKGDYGSRSVHIAQVTTQMWLKIASIQDVPLDQHGQSNVVIAVSPQPMNNNTNRGSGDFIIRANIGYQPGIVNTGGWSTYITAEAAVGGSFDQQAKSATWDPTTDLLINYKTNGNLAEIWMKQIGTSMAGNTFAQIIGGQNNTGPDESNYDGSPWLICTASSPQASPPSGGGAVQAYGTWTKKLVGDLAVGGNLLMTGSVIEMPSGGAIKSPGSIYLDVDTDGGGTGGSAVIRGGTGTSIVAYIRGDGYVRLYGNTIYDSGGADWLSSDGEGRQNMNPEFINKDGTFADINNRTGAYTGTDFVPDGNNGEAVNILGVGNDNYTHRINGLACVQGSGILTNVVNTEGTGLEFGWDEDASAGTFDVGNEFIYYGAGSFQRKVLRCNRTGAGNMFITTGGAYDLPAGDWFLSFKLAKRTGDTFESADEFYVKTSTNNFVSSTTILTLELNNNPEAGGTTLEQVQSSNGVYFANGGIANGGASSANITSEAYYRRMVAFTLTEPTALRFCFDSTVSNENIYLWEVECGQQYNGSRDGCIDFYSSRGGYDQRIQYLQRYFSFGSGTSVGSITMENATIQYNNFTGQHPAYTGGHQLGEHSIVRIDSLVSNPGAEPVYEVSNTTTAKDKAVIGVYGVMSNLSEGADCGVRAVGNGRIQVCSENGNIEIGDFICSSNTSGHGMKQDEQQLMNFTVAKATEPVDWSTEDSTEKIITCTYHAG